MADDVAEREWEDWPAMEESAERKSVRSGLEGALQMRGSLPSPQPGVEAIQQLSRRERKRRKRT
jgi:hypothetical protein